MSKMDSVVHFEMPYDDRERMAKFYRDAFGWQATMSLPPQPNLMRAVRSDRVRSMAAFLQENPIGRGNIRPSSLRLMTSRPR